MFFFNHPKRKRHVPNFFRSEVVTSLNDEVRRYFSLSEKHRAQTDVPKIWQQSIPDDVTIHLERHSYGKCAFCDSHVVGTRPYRFRPPAHALPDLKGTNTSAYLWHAWNWRNFYPICNDCLPENPRHFPISSQQREEYSPSNLENIPEHHRSIDWMQERQNPESPLLYYPGEDGILNEFRINEEGVLHSSSERGQETIAQYKLNRRPLVIKRWKAIQYQIKCLSKNTIFGSRDKARRFERIDLGGARFLFLKQLYVHSAGLPFETFDSTTPDSLIRSYTRREIIDRVKKLLGLEEQAKKSVAAGAALPAEEQDEEATVQEEIIGKIKEEENLAIANAITSISIDNFKTIESMEIKIPEPIVDGENISTEYFDPLKDQFAPCIMLLGENAAGKSSILKAITLACLDIEARYHLYEKNHINFNNLILDPFYLGAQEGNEPEASHTSIRFQNKTEYTLKIAPNHYGEPSDLSVDKRHPYLFAYGPHRMFGKSISAKSPISRVKSLFLDTSRISNPERWLLQLWEKDNDAFQGVIRALRGIISIDGEFKTLEPGRNREDQECLFMIQERTRIDGSKYSIGQDFSVMSSGYSAILAIVCDIFRGLLEHTDNIEEARNLPAVVIIDEIEAHLHPRWKISIIGSLRKALPNTTFIFSSHDPLCVRGMNSNEVFIVNRFQKNDAPAASAQEKVEVINCPLNTDQMTVEQLLTSNLFDILSPNDPDLEKQFDRICEILTKAPKIRTDEEKDILAQFTGEVCEGLPFGQSEVTTAVHRAVADYMVGRRKQSTERIKELEKKVKEEITGFLEGVLS